MAPGLMLLVAVAGQSALMAMLWLLQRRTGNAGWVDAGWAAGTGGSAVLFALLSDGEPVRRLLAGGLLGVWALRLAWHIVRRLTTEAEDGRYVRLRLQWKDRFQPKLLLFYQVQGGLAVLFAVPALVVASGDSPLTPIQVVAGLGIWVAAVVGETVADHQLARFRSNPANRGRTCRRGLWGASRHPNYFFEWLHWWTYVPLAAGVATWWATLLGPVLMLVFLVKITGIPATEAHAAASRPDYRDYQLTTSAFVPWFKSRPR